MHLVDEQHRLLAVISEGGAGVLYDGPHLFDSG
ncbi:Uncharacterised protein [Mycobacteroides abscessus subsp. abscessus]|nr:Uncharacterised protein [Mycobacteroides abscessus subsp. abscessus]